MKILAERRNGWVEAIIQNRWVEAKLYNLPSRFGINNGRVSKCAIGKSNKRDSCKKFFSQMDYNYDRGLDFDNLPPGVLNKIIAELESLPPEHSH